MKRLQRIGRLLFPSVVVLACVLVAEYLTPIVYLLTGHCVLRYRTCFPPREYRIEVRRGETPEVRIIQERP